MWKTENPSSLKFTQQLVLRSVFLLSKWKLKKWKVACLFIWKNSEFYFRKMTCNTRCWLAKPEPNHLVQNKCRVCYCCSTVRKNWVAVCSLSSFWHNLTVLHGRQRVEQYMTTSEVNHGISFVYNSKTIEMCALKFDLIWKNIKLVYKLQFFLNLVLGQLSNLWVKLEQNRS